MAPHSERVPSDHTKVEQGSIAIGCGRLARGEMASREGRTEANGRGRIWRKRRETSRGIEDLRVGSQEARADFVAPATTTLSLNGGHSARAWPNQLASPDSINHRLTGDAVRASRPSGELLGDKLQHEQLVRGAGLRLRRPSRLSDSILPAGRRMPPKLGLQRRAWKLLPPLLLLLLPLSLFQLSLAARASGAGHATRRSANFGPLQTTTDDDEQGK